MKILGVLLILLVLLPATGTTQSSSGDKKEDPAGKVCLDLRSGKIVQGGSCFKISGPVIWGTLLKGTFEPSNIVENFERAEEPDSKFTPGWMELRTGKTHPDNEGREPESPYLRGRIDPKGGFHVYPEDLRKWMSQKPPISPKYEPDPSLKVPPVKPPVPPEPLPIAPRKEEAGVFTPAIQCNPALAQLPTKDLYQGYKGFEYERMTTAGPYEYIPVRGVFRVQDWEFSITRKEGRIFVTGLLQPPGTIPLYSWHKIRRNYPGGVPSEVHAEGLVTTSPAWSGTNQVIIYDGKDLTTREKAGPLSRWEFQGIEGYIFAQPCPGTLPLYSWYSPFLGNYIITTDPSWAGNIGDTRERYSLVRIEGYVLPPAEGQR